MAPALHEPVTWQARLQVVAGAAYTEVAGTAVAVVPDTGCVVLLSPAVAGLLARLDGRPLDEALAVDLPDLAPHDRRRVLEYLRRLKAAELIEDAPTSGTTAPVGWEDPPPVADTVTVAGHVASPDELSGASRPRRPPVLVLGESDDRITIGRPGRGGTPFASVETSSPADEGPKPAEAADALDVFAALVKALDPIEQITRPGVADLLADLAETTDRS